jgi:membrane associated rhomboid family serine protease
MGRTIIWATLVAGTLDIVFAGTMSLIRGSEPATMLRSVASGPFPGASEWGAAGSALGLLTHFSLMAVMAAVFVLGARQRPALIEKPILWGVLYGLITYVVMNLIVLPLRFGAPLPPPAHAIAAQLFAHIVLVGIPIALIAARRLNPSPVRGRVSA